jgi:hypothetical protein
MRVRPRPGPSPLAQIEACGWLGDVSAAEGRRLRAALRTGTGSLSEALRSGSYDPEGIEDGDEYRRILQAYSRASGSVFRPTRVRASIDWRRRLATIAYEAGDRTFSRTFPQPDDFVGDGFHDYVNETLAALRIPQRFYDLGTGGQAMDLVFLRPRTYARARRLGLIEPSR